MTRIQKRWSLVVCLGVVVAAAPVAVVMHSGCGGKSDEVPDLDADVVVEPDAEGADEPDAIAVDHGDFLGQEGSYSATLGDCGVSSFVLSNPNEGIVLTPFGENSSATFLLVPGQTNQADADGLIILSVPNHDCRITINVSPPVRITLVCMNSGGGLCSQEYARL
jgi:hypothetical protein